jgi:hypothetical protein
MPGHIFLVDFNSHRVIEDKELKAKYASSNPYPEWLDQNAFSLNDVVESMPTKLQQVRPSLPLFLPSLICTTVGNQIFAQLLSTKYLHNCW